MLRQEPRLRAVLEDHAAHKPLVASVLSARFEKRWGEPLRPNEWGFNKVSTLLRAMSAVCEVETMQRNSASAPVLLVRPTAPRRLIAPVCHLTHLI